MTDKASNILRFMGKHCKKPAKIKDKLKEEFSKEKNINALIEKLKTNKFDEPNARKGLDAIPSGVNHIFEKGNRDEAEAYMIYICKKPIDKLLSFKELNLNTKVDDYLAQTKNLLMLIGMDCRKGRDLYVQGIHRTPFSMLEKGKYRGLSMILHSFIAKVMLDKFKANTPYSVIPTPAMREIISKTLNIKQSRRYDLPLNILAKKYFKEDCDKKTKYSIKIAKETFLALKFNLIS